MERRAEIGALLQGLACVGRDDPGVAPVWRWFAPSGRAARTFGLSLEPLDQARQRKDPELAGANEELEAAQRRIRTPHSRRLPDGRSRYEDGEVSRGAGFNARI